MAAKLEKDKRLYARFDISFDEHDKIFPLSDAAFRAIVEATLYSRRLTTDGFLGERLALKRWGAEVLDELTTNDPEKPSLVRVDGGWQIHDFAEHQTTKADIEAKRKAGAKGAAKRWGASPIAPPMAPAMGDPMRIDGGTLAKTETETEPETETPPTSSKDSVEGGAPPRLCTIHSHWDHEDRCRKCGDDRRAAESWAEAEAKKPRPPKPHVHKWLTDGTCNTCEARKETS